MKKAFGDIAVSTLPSAIKVLWYSRHEEPEPEEFVSLPEWMEPVERPESLDQRRVVACLLSTLSEREQEVLRLRMGHDCTHKEIGKVFGVTKTRVAQIEHKALRKCRHPWRVMMLALAFDVTCFHDERWAREAKETYATWLGQQVEA